MCISGVMSVLELSALPAALDTLVLEFYWGVFKFRKLTSQEALTHILRVVM